MLLNVWSPDSSMVAPGSWLERKQCLRPAQSEPLWWSPVVQAFQMQVQILNPQGSTKGHFFHEAFLDFQSCLLGCECFVRPLNHHIT